MKNQREIHDSGVYIAFDEETSTYFIGCLDQKEDLCWTEISNAMYDAIATTLNVETQSLKTFVYQEIPNNLSYAEAVARDVKYIQGIGSDSLTRKDHLYAEYQREVLAQMYEL